MGIGILIVVIGSAIYKGRHKIQKKYNGFREKITAKIRNIKNGII